MHSADSPTGPNFEAMKTILEDPPLQVAEGSGGRH